MAPKEWRNIAMVSKELWGQTGDSTIKVSTKLLINPNRNDQNKDAIMFSLRDAYLFWVEPTNE